MTALERLQVIAATLPPDAVDALVAVAERMMPAQEFAAYLAAQPEEPVDEETAVRIDAALNEPGPSIPHDEMWNRLGRL